MTLCIDVLINKNTDKALLVCKRNIERCRKLWMGQKRHYRKSIKTYESAEKYGYEKLWIEKALKELKKDLEEEKELLRELKEEQEKSNFSYLFDEEIDESRYEISRLLCNIKNIETGKKFKIQEY